jgi:hypothetical protein
MPISSGMKYVKYRQRDRQKNKDEAVGVEKHSPPTARLPQASPRPMAVRKRPTARGDRLPIERTEGEEGTISD